MTFLSPLGSPIRGSAYRNRTANRARGRATGGQWSPAYLGLWAWWDVHIGGSSSGITDASGNGRTLISNGASTAAAQYLAYTSTPYVWLEAATSGTNSVSCTAPAAAASYSAAPLDGGAATTGAATGGVTFTFTTAGSWKTISLLNGSGVEVARYAAADSTQTGHTDGYGVAWTVNRGTAGRKTVVLSPRASSTRSLMLLGANDGLSVPVAALPPQTAATNWTFGLAFRQFATATSFGRLLETKESNTGTAKGFHIANQSTSAQVRMSVADGTTEATLTGGTFTNGTAAVVMAWRDSTKQIGMSINSTVTTPVSSTSVGDVTAVNRLGVGRLGGSVANTQDLELLAVWASDRVLSASEFAQIVAYYGGGL